MQAQPFFRESVCNRKSRRSNSAPFQPRGELKTFELSGFGQHGPLHVAPHQDFVLQPRRAQRAPDEAARAMAMLGVAIFSSNRP